MFSSPRPALVVSCIVLAFVALGSLKAASGSRRAQGVSGSETQGLSGCETPSVTDTSTPRTNPLVMAFYFPFAPDPLNDRLWGDGFVEWDHLKKAPAKNRKGRRLIQPLEMYDPLALSTRQEQGRLARHYGLDGFIYHHYWFHHDDTGGATMSAVLEEMLNDGEPNVDVFALHWCNTDWRPKWNGRAEKDFHVDQRYPKGNSSVWNHYVFLRRFFQHPKYLFMDGKPVLFVIETNLPEVRPMLIRLSAFAKQDDFPGIYFVSTLTRDHPISPNMADRPLIELKADSVFSGHFFYPQYIVTSKSCTRSLPKWCLRGRRSATGREPHFLGIISDFDNTPRRLARDALFFEDECDFEANFRVLMQYTQCCTKNPIDQRLAVVNAWNEWGEGMALEPSKEHGTALLEALQRVVDESRKDGFCMLQS